MTARGRTPWSTDDVGDLSGHVALITGAGSGIGLGAAKVLAAHGATVAIAARSEQRAGAATDAIRALTPNAKVEVLVLDLACLASIREAAATFVEGHPRLDLLINNAGVMVPPLGHTADGFELQFGTNHLGHFALTGLLLERLLATPGSRVVTISSSTHRQGSVDFNNLQSERGYSPGRAYAQSKLANLLFTYELQRRLAAAGASTIAVAAHPGWARTDLQRHASANWWWTAARWVEPVFSQDADAGALPTLRAACDPAVEGGDYYGPSGFMEGKGRPVLVKSSARSYDQAAAARLWGISEELTGVRYEALGQAAAAQ